MSIMKNMPHKIIFRDDDISHATDLDKFARVHELFNKYGVVHTIAVITQGIARNKELCQYIRSQDNIDVQLHGREHIDYAVTDLDTVSDHLSKGAETIRLVFNKRPTVFYPPWNSVNDNVITIAKSLGLETSYQKITLSQYIRVNGSVKEDVINFHYWADQEAMMIEPALRIYTEKNKS